MLYAMKQNLTNATGMKNLHWQQTIIIKHALPAITTITEQPHWHMHFEFISVITSNQTSHFFKNITIKKEKKKNRQSPFDLSKQPGH